jgi:hypothetical protein
MDHAFAVLGDLKPWIGTTFVDKGFDLFHDAFTSGPPDVDDIRHA